MKNKYSSGQRALGWFCLLFCAFMFGPIGWGILAFGLIEVYSKEPK